MTTTSQIAVELELDRVTANKIRFAEQLESQFATEKLGTVYVPKTTLAELGWEEGKKVRVTLEVV